VLHLQPQEAKEASNCGVAAVTKSTLYPSTKSRNKDSVDRSDRMMGEDEEDSVLQASKKDCE